MVDRKVVPFDEFYYQLKLMHLLQKHSVYVFYKNQIELRKMYESLKISNSGKYSETDLLVVLAEKVDKIRKRLLRFENIDLLKYELPEAFSNVL
jgi:hypothetical protein